MTIKKPKIKLYPDPRHQEENVYLIQVQISYGGRAYISTGKKFSKKEWAIIQDRNITQDKENNFTSRKLKDIRTELDVFESRTEQIAQRFIDRNMPFTATMIRDAFYNFKPSSLYRLSLYHLFTNLYESSLLNGRAPKTAESYLNARSAFFNYKKYIEEFKKGKILSEPDIERLKDNFKIIEIDAKFIREFEATITSPPPESGLKKISSATVQSYCINLRTVFNFCIKEGIIGEESYPFNAKNHSNYYKIRPSQRTKKALFEDDITKLINIAPHLPKAQRRALDFFMFSILTNGANLVDIAKLKKIDVDEDLNTISFVRQKTEKNVDNLDPIVIQLTDIHHEIIERNKSTKTTNDFIFNLLDDIQDNTPLEITRVISNHLRNFKMAYKRISKKVGIKTFTYQYARHTYATLAVKKIGNIEAIGKSMGHVNPKSTKNYIASLPVQEATEITKLKSSLLGGYITTGNNE